MSIINKTGYKITIVVGINNDTIYLENNGETSINYIYFNEDNTVIIKITTIKGHEKEFLLNKGEIKKIKMKIIGNTYPSKNNISTIKNLTGYKIIINAKNNKEEMKIQKDNCPNIPLNWFNEDNNVNLKIRVSNGLNTTLPLNIGYIAEIFLDFDIEEEIK